MIIGKREEKEVPVVDGEEAEGRRAAGPADSGEGGYTDSREEGRALLADGIELETDTEEVKRKGAAKRLEEEDILDLDQPATASSVRL